MTEHCDLNHAPIGVFDSGVGGLTVAREIMRQIPDERIVYFGDTARVPYGSKSPNTIIRYSRQIIRFLRTKNVKAIVVACNTASAFALETIKPELDIPIIGVKLRRRQHKMERSESSEQRVRSAVRFIQKPYIEKIRMHRLWAGHALYLFL